MTGIRRYTLVYLGILTLFMLSFTSAIDWSNKLDRYYSFNESAGVTVTDYSGYAQDGTSVNGNWEVGYLGNALDFNGVDEKVTITNFSLIDDTSINFWVNSDGFNDLALFGSVDDADAYVYFPDSTTIGIQSDLGADYTAWTLPAMATGGYHMITITKTGGNVRVYFNGTESVSGAQAFANPLTITLLGAYNGGTYWAGSMDEMSMWNRSLSSADAEDLWNSGAGLNLSGQPPGISVTVNAPANNLQTLNTTVHFNATILPYGLDLVNATLRMWNSDDTIYNTTTNVMGTGSNDTLFNIYSIPFGNYTYEVFGCQGTGGSDNCATSNNQTVAITPWLEQQLHGPATTLVGDTIDFAVELNLSSGITINSYNFVYDDVSYTASLTATGGDNYNLTRSLLIPSSTGAKNYYFNFSLSDTGTTKGNSSTGSITVSSLAIDDCSGYSNILYNFTVYDEQSLFHITNPFSLNGSLNLQVWDNSDAVSVANYSTTYENKSEFLVCLDTALTADSNYVADLELQYGAYNYATEFYTMVNEPLTNADMGTEVGLYDLINSSAQAFKILYKDASFLPVPDAVIQIQRRYIGEGLFRTVEQPKTDSNGETVAHLEVENVIYNFVILKNGVVDAVFNNVVAVCPNPALDPCEISLNNLQSFTNIIDYSNVGNISFDINFDKDTRSVSADYTVTTGNSIFFSLNVTLFDNFGNTTICSDYLVSPGGSLSCTIPNSFGNTTVIADVYGGSIHLGRSIISLNEDPSDIYGESLIFLGLIIVISLAGISLSGNPIISGVFLILSSVLLVALNIVYSTSWLGAGATMLWFIVAVIIVLIKGANR